MSEKVYISKYLGETNRGRAVAEDLNNILGDKLNTIPLNKNEWCRDYMPVKASDGGLVLFKYMPSYLVGRSSYEKTIPNQISICNRLKLKYEASQIIMDGGAIEIIGGKGIVSDRVIADNSTAWERNAPIVLDEIKRKLKLEKLIIVPSDPWDFTGHMDGLVRFIDDKNVLINDLKGLDQKMKDEASTYEQELYDRWKNNFELSLHLAGFKIHKLTCEAHHNSNEKSAKGIYLNFLKLDDMIIMPEYEGDKFQSANSKAKEEICLHYPKKQIISVKADKLSDEGGIINCVTWTT